MKLVFYTNYLNHHQVLVADELYRLLGDDFCFVATLPVNENELKGGDDFSMRPYCFLAAENEDAHNEALNMARVAEVCVFGAFSQEYAIERAKNIPQGITFEMGERWLKRGWLTMGSHVFRKWLINYWRYYRKANFYKLCCSSFTAKDDLKLKAYQGRHYKWGYFIDVNKELEERKTDGAIKILWCARYIKLKHPELVAELAARLKNDGYNFSIDMYGDEGQLAPHDKPFSKKELEKRINTLGVKNYVNLMGNRPNSEIIKAMCESDIFLFTSDKLEGWGVVANESMANGCALVASDAIGSTAYLVTHKETGMIFKSGDIDSLYNQVKYLIDNPLERERIAKSGRRTMVGLWSPENAAKSLLQLIEDLKAGRETTILNGPCSKA